MKILFLALWLQMSAPTTPHCIDRPAACGNIEHVCDNGPSTVTLAECISPAMIEELNQAAQRAADETDGKPPKCEPGIKNCVCAAPNKCRDFTQKEWEEFQAENAPEPVPEPVDVPAVRESLPSVCSFQGFQPMQCTNNGELDWSLAQTRGFIKEGEGVPGKNGHIYKCKDTSRVLLTSEDGKKHCIKF